MNEVQWIERNPIQTVTWHYVMDIHDPENYWYSTDRMLK